MKKIKLNTLGLQEPFRHHKKLKAKLLNLINNSSSERDVRKDAYYGDSITKYDWNIATDFNREWVQYIKPYLQEQFDKFSRVLNHGSPLIKKVWFQQYNKDDYHGWHIHGDNYTGVYYLDFPRGSTPTELIEQGSLNKITIKAKEGDILIFPAFIIHRSPRIVKDIQKTIISFNIEMYSVNSSIFPKIK